MMRTPFCFANLEGANACLLVDNINRAVSTFPFNDRNFKDTYGNCWKKCFLLLNLFIFP